MLRLFQAGLFAACIQCIAAGTATLALFLAVQHDLIFLASPRTSVLTPNLNWTHFCPFCGGFIS